MADVVEEPSDAPLAVEQVSQSFEQPMGFEPADTPPPAETQDTEVQPSADDGSSSSIDDEAESKKIEESTPIPPSYLASESHEYAAAVDTTPASPSEKWNQLLDKVHPSVMKHAETVANHPVVNLLRQRAGQAHQSVVNHLYVQVRSRPAALQRWKQGRRCAMIQGALLPSLQPSSSSWLCAFSTQVRT